MGLLWSIITWAFSGLIIGAIARFLYPGRQSMSMFATMALGIVGSFVGGFISWLFGYDPQDGPLRGAGWIMSVVGGLIVVWLGLYASGRGKSG